MKKTVLFLLIFVSFVSFAQDKSFKKKTVLIELNANFGIYNTEGSDSTSRATGKSDEDKAAPYGFGLGFEVGLLDRVGIGLRGQMLTYLTSKDSATGATPQAKARDIALLVNLHLIRTKRFDLALGATGGYSGFKYSANDSKASIAKGGGFTYDFHLTPRVYFGDHFGMHLNITYIGYGYNKLKISNNERTFTDQLTYKASGMNFALGVQLKF